MIKTSNTTHYLIARDVLGSYGSPWIKSEEERAKLAISCRDTDYIKKVSSAGEIKTHLGQDVQIMHNGLLVHANGYQGEWEAEIIKELHGHHEPQEEKVFHEVLKRIDSGGVMVELGSWWSYYSMWFAKTVKDSLSICCEPDPQNLKLGHANARINFLDQRMKFLATAAGDQDSKIVDFVTENKQKIKVPIKTIDKIVEEFQIDSLSLLHMDIQGFELSAIKGAEKTIKEGKLRFLFVSTHHYAISGDPNIHNKCIEYIKRSGGHIIARHTILESFSGDGLIVASFDERDQDFFVEVSLQHTDDSLFRSAEIDTAVLWDSYDNLLVNYNHERETHAESIEILERQVVLGNERIEQLSDLYYNRRLIHRFKDIIIYILKIMRKQAKKILGQQNRAWSDATTLDSISVNKSGDISMDKLLELYDVKNLEKCLKSNQPNKIQDAIFFFSNGLYQLTKKILRRAKKIFTGYA